MIRPLAASALALCLSLGAHAQEPVAIDYSALPATHLSADRTKPFAASYSAEPRGKEIYRDANADLSVAMCGLEGHKDAADLDAGLLDYNVADPARAAGGAFDESKDLGKSRYDFRSSIVLGVTLGYRF